jgi:hypothetical protein
LGRQVLIGMAVGVALGVFGVLQRIVSERGCDLQAAAGYLSKPRRVLNMRHLTGGFALNLQ